MKLYFYTSSSIKFNHYKFIFHEQGIKLIQEPVKLFVLEPQIEDSSDDHLMNLVLHPLKQMARFIENEQKYPAMIEDTILQVDFFNTTGSSVKLPGADTKNWWKALGNEGILSIMGETTRRSARFVSIIGIYSGKGEYRVYQGYTDGQISMEVRESQNPPPENKVINPHFFHKIFIPDGSKKTMAEMDYIEFESFDYRRKYRKDYK